MCLQSDGPEWARRLGGRAGAEPRGHNRDLPRARTDLADRERSDFLPSEKDAKLAQKLAQLQPFLAAFPPERMGQLASLIFGACNLTPTPRLQLEAMRLRWDIGLGRIVAVYCRSSTLYQNG